jgi:hypothetical protein
MISIPRGTFRWLSGSARICAAWGPVRWLSWGGHNYDNSALAARPRCSSSAPHAPRCRSTAKKHRHTQSAQNRHTKPIYYGKRVNKLARPERARTGPPGPRRASGTHRSRTSASRGEMSDWLKRCRLVHAFLSKHLYKRLKLAQLLGQHGVFITPRPRIHEPHQKAGMVAGKLRSNHPFRPPHPWIRMDNGLPRVAAISDAENDQSRIQHELFIFWVSV